MYSKCGRQGRVRQMLWLRYDQMNSRIDEYKTEYYYENYAASLEAVQKNKMALDTMVNDSLIQAIVDGWILKGYR